MTVFVTLRLVELGSYGSEHALERAIYRYRRACVALYENGVFKLYGLYADHKDDPIDFHLQYELGTELKTDNLSLAVLTLYRPATAIVVEQHEPIAIVSYSLVADEAEIDNDDSSS